MNKAITKIKRLRDVALYSLNKNKTYMEDYLTGKIAAYEEILEILEGEEDESTINKN